jgi:hypothetical protein
MQFDTPSSPVLSAPSEPFVVHATTGGGFPSTTAAASSFATIAPSLEKQIVVIERRLLAMKGSSADDLVEDLRRWSKEAEYSAQAALSAAHYAIIHAWATGCVFNLAKEAMGHSSFGRWRDAKAAELGISVRKAQQWMKLAKDCWDARALLIPGATLTGAYRATGVLPEPPAPIPTGEDDTTGGGDPPPPQPVSSPAELAFTALAEGRKRLRHLLESGELLGDVDRDRLDAEKTAYLTLFDKLLNPIVP